MNLITAFEQTMGTKPRKHPEIRPGYTVRVHQRVKEGDKERVQVFEGLVIAVHKAGRPNHTITLRRIASGVGVEKVFTLFSPLIEKVEVKKKAKVRRSKLYYLRQLSGKSARLQETHVNLTTDEIKAESKKAKPVETDEAVIPSDDAPATPPEKGQ